MHYTSLSLIEEKEEYSTFIKKSDATSVNQLLSFST